jgi:hypothetical protein
MGRTPLQRGTSPLNSRAEHGEEYQRMPPYGKWRAIGGTATVHGVACCPWMKFSSSVRKLILVPPVPSPAESERYHLILRENGRH